MNPNVRGGDMRSRRSNFVASVSVLGLLSVGLWACSQSTGGGGSGGKTGSGGAASGGSGSGGTTGSGGSNGTGGVTGSGGSTVTGTGGTTSSGGTTVTGTGGKNTGGSATGGTETQPVGTGGVQGTGGVTGKGGTTTGPGTGGTTGPGGTGGRDGGPGTGGMRMPDGGPGTGGGPGSGGSTGMGGGLGSGGSTGTGTCTKGQVKPSEVVFMGESFYAIAPQYIETRVESDAQAAGSLASGAKYRNVAVSGQTMNYVLTTEWPAATQGGTVKNVIMDGGGIDAMSSDCASCPGDLTTLLGKMATEGVTDVIYTRYPEPGSPPGSNTTLKGHLDNLMPKMQTVCQGSTSPKCHWVDLRPVWQTNDVQSDGLHPTQSGGNHVGDLIWSEMVKDCMAQ